MADFLKLSEYTKNSIFRGLLFVNYLGRIRVSAEGCRRHLPGLTQQQAPAAERRGDHVSDWVGVGADHGLELQRQQRVITRLMREFR